MNNINKVAIFGLARSGKSALRLAQSRGIRTIVVNQGDVALWFSNTDGLVAREDCYSEDEASEVFTQVDFIVLSPGIPREHKSMELALSQGVPVISEIEFAYRLFSHIPVIAITGTNGKTTTTTMITQALEELGKRVFCGGNIGIPYSDIALVNEDIDYAVIEVSSFQLESIQEFHPKVALILNVFPNHTERYSDVESYAIAKNNIYKNLNKSDLLIIGKENPFLHLIETQAMKSYFSIESLSEFERTFDFSKAHLKGKHNEANFLATKLTLDFLQLGDQESFQRFIETFTGVEHRLEFVKEYQGLRIYNDAKSTNSLATVTAIKAFEEPIYLIVGGKLRNESDKLLPDFLLYKEKIKKIFLIGEVTERLFLELGSEFEVEKSYDVKNVLKYAKDHGLVGELVFSPAHPSFDQFKSFVDRGESFKKWVNEIFQ
ncbi:MAG: UDP-N-acetylmuramoyl-L-alanine--D-glutamate ligase [Bacteriovoracaceae bacterium]